MSSYSTHQIRSGQISIACLSTSDKIAKWALLFKPPHLIHVLTNMLATDWSSSWEIGLVKGHVDSFRGSELADKQAKKKHVNEHRRADFDTIKFNKSFGKHQQVAISCQRRRRCGANLRWQRTHVCQMTDATMTDAKMTDDTNDVLGRREGGRGSQSTYC